MRGTRRQLLHMASGVLIALLLGAHMVVIHLDDILRFFGGAVADPVAWEAMMARSGQVVWAGVYVALLALALYHGLYGLRGILLEVISSPRAERALTRLFLALGVLIFAWGAYVPVFLLGE